MVQTPEICAASVALCRTEVLESSPDLDQTANEAIAIGAPSNVPYELSVAFLSHVSTFIQEEASRLLCAFCPCVLTFGLHRRNVGSYINVHPVPGADSRRLCSCREPMVCSLHTPSRRSSLLSLATRDAGACIVSLARRSGLVQQTATVHASGDMGRQRTHPWRRCCATKTLRKAQRHGRVSGGSGHLPDRSHPPSQLQLPAPSLI